MGTSKFNAGGNLAMDYHPIQRGVEILLHVVASCYGNHDKLRPDQPLGSYAGFTYLPPGEGCFRHPSYTDANI